jgi:drug/metabolite transporter (DMT)-like permease
LKRKLLIGLLAAILFDTLLQIVWKTAVLTAPSAAPPLALSPLADVISVLGNPLFIGIIAIMTFQFFNWLVVLGQADLSYAKPVASLSYAAVPILSVIILNEAIDRIEIAGVFFVIAGVWFISKTNPSTKNAPKLP